MAKDNLQLHGQSLSSGEEADSGIGGKSWLELKKIVAQKYDQGKDLSSQASHKVPAWSALG